MNISTTRSVFRNPLEAIAKSRIRSASVYGGIIILAMFAFEAFNYSTTAYALRDLLGDLRFAEIQWATLMALAFCGLDFAGIATLINQKGRQENQKESWYLFGAWLIAGTFNAALTWWGVSIAIANHSLSSTAVMSINTLTRIVPIFVAILVWVVRILIIGSLTTALERVNQAKTSADRNRGTVSTSAGFPTRPQRATAYTRPVSAERSSHSVAARSQSQPTYQNFNNSTNRRN